MAVVATAHTPTTISAAQKRFIGVRKLESRRPRSIVRYG
jgi:hypothetical protein